MQTQPTTAQQPAPAPETGQSVSRPPESTKVPAENLRETLTEIHETILLVEQALIPAMGTKRKRLAKADKGSEKERVCGEAEELIQQCVEVIRSEQKASVSLLCRRLRLGYGRAALIMDELERRKIVGPSNGVEPREVLIDLDGGRAEGTVPEEDPYEALLRACLKGDLAKVQALLTTGLDVNRQPGGLTALHCAACNGYMAIVQLLLDNDANVDPRLGLIKGATVGPYLEGATPFILAMANHKDSVARLLVSRGANLQAKTHKGHAGEVLGQAFGNITFDLGS